MVWIEGVARSRRCRTREFGCRRFSENNGSGAPCQSDTGRLVRCAMFVIERRAHLRRKIGCIDDVFDAERHAMQRAAERAAVTPTCLFQAFFGINCDPSPNQWITLGDPVKAFTQDSLGCERALSNASHYLCCGQSI